MLRKQIANTSGVEKINGDLHQPSEIRYESRSFSVRCLVSLVYGKWLIFAVNLSIVVPRAIGSFLRNTLGIIIIIFLNLIMVWLSIAQSISRSAGITEKNSYGLGYHNRKSNCKNQSFPICKRNQTSNTKGSQNIPYSGWLM